MSTLFRLKSALYRNIYSYSGFLNYLHQAKQYHIVIKQLVVKCARIKYKQYKTYGISR